MTNKTRIKRLETHWTQLLYNKQVTTFPPEYWNRSLDALASVLHIPRAELEDEWQKLSRSTNNRITRRHLKAMG